MGLTALKDMLIKHFPNKQLVFGEGPQNAAVMLIGEAPGREEAESGRPFVGKAGKNLSEFLQLINLRRQAIYITNVVKFRPTKISAKGSISNRPPRISEIKQFLPYLHSEIAAINPKLIVTMGNTALKALMGRDVSIGGLHGQLHGLGDRQLFALFHPASIIYKPQLKDVYTTDILALRDVIIANGYTDLRAGDCV